MSTAPRTVGSAPVAQAAAVSTPPYQLQMAHMAHGSHPAAPMAAYGAYPYGATPQMVMVTPEQAALMQQQQQAAYLQQMQMQQHMYLHQAHAHAHTVAEQHGVMPMMGPDVSGGQATTAGISAAVAPASTDCASTPRSQGSTAEGSTWNDFLGKMAHAPKEGEAATAGAAGFVSPDPANAAW